MLETCSASLRIGSFFICSFMTARVIMSFRAGLMSINGRERLHCLSTSCRTRLRIEAAQSKPTLAYILRHTQLLPRHLVEMFNFIFRAAIDPENGHIGVIQQRMSFAASRAVRSGSASA